MPRDKNALLLLQLCAFLVFAGRAYQFYFFGAPFRALLWDESLMTPLVERIFNTPWYDYATSETVNFRIEALTKICSVILLLAGIVCLFWRKLHIGRIKNIIVVSGLAVLVFLGICLVKDRNYDVLQFFELSIQLAAPILLLAVSRSENIVGDKRLIFWAKVAAALTFVPHGLFAMGLIYLPGHFVDMTIKILGVTETQAGQILFVAGFLDLISAVLIFVPKLSRYALLYMVIWGLLTAMARIVAGFNADFPGWSVHQHAFLSVYRLPHGLFPLAILLFERRTFEEPSNTTHNIDSK